MRRFLYCLLVVSCVLASGCSNFNLKGIYKPYEQGDFDTAAEVARGINLGGKEGEEADPDDNDVLWVALEKGKVLQDAGDFQGSLEVFEWHMGQIAADRDAQDQVLVGGRKATIGNLKAMLTDDRVQSYFGTTYDLINARTAHALSAMGAQNKDQAMLALSALDLHVDGAEFAHQEQIQSLEKLISYGDPEVNDNDRKMMQRQAQQAFSNRKNVRGKPGLAHRDFVLPYGLYVAAGIYHSLGDSHRAIIAARKAATASPNCQAAAKMVAIATEGRDSRHLVQVLFENGMSPIRCKHEHPLSDVGVVIYPDLHSRPIGRAKRLLVNVAGQAPMPTELIDSIDSTMHADFDEIEPALFQRAVIRTMVKAGVIASAAQVLDKYKAWVKLFGFLWANAERADVRSFRSMCADRQVATVLRPANGELLLELIGDDDVITKTLIVSLPAGPSAVIVRSLRHGHLSAQVVPYSFITAQP